GAGGAGQGCGGGGSEPEEPRGYGQEYTARARVPGRAGGAVVPGPWRAAAGGRGAFRGATFFFSSRRRHTRLQGDWSSDVCSSDLVGLLVLLGEPHAHVLFEQRGEPDRWLARELGGDTGVEQPARPEAVVAVQDPQVVRSEERRVGKEGGWRGEGEGE